MKLHRRRKKALRLPRFRLYQQIIVYFILVVLIPLLGASFIIYNINQKALKKELNTFTEHTADSIYQDLQMEMNWQKSQFRTLGQVFFQWLGQPAGNTAVLSRLQTASDSLFTLNDRLTGVALYDAQGRLLYQRYRPQPLPQNNASANSTATVRQNSLPSQIDPSLFNITENKPASKAEPLRKSKEPVGPKPKFEVVFDREAKPEQPRYFLRGLLPVAGLIHPHIESDIAYFVAEVRFDFLQSLIQQKNRALFDGFFLINQSGQVIAGPSTALRNPQYVSAQDRAFFNHLSPGVSKELSTSAKTLPNLADIGDGPDEAVGELQKVFVKMADVGWGIIIESPYNVRQKYIKRARNQTLLLIMACVAVVIGFTMFYVLGIHRNFRQLIKGIKAMAEGRYSRRIRLISRWYTPYEIFFLTGEFNRMGRKIAEAWDESQTLTDELQSANVKLSKLDEMKSNLIDTVSHELRTPLTSIKGYSARLIRYDDTLDRESRIKSLKVIKRQADRLGRLVDDLLAIPELESETLRVFPDRVNLPDLLERSVHFIQQKDARQILVHLPDAFTRGDITLDIWADPDRLEQVVLNLLDNAVKYSQPTDYIDVSVTPLTDNMVSIAISNPCEPIGEEQLETLFDKFQRLDESMTRTTRGSGLGLFITKGLIEAMNGHISLHYQNGRFNVSFTLPAYEGDPEMPSPADETQAMALLGQ